MPGSAPPTPIRARRRRRSSRRSCATPDRRPADPRAVVDQRKGRARRRHRRLVCGQARAGGDEARGPQRRRRPVHERRGRRSARGAGARRRRRPIDAQLAERAGFAVLRGLRAGSLPRAGEPAGVLRLHPRGLRPVREAAGAGAAAPGHPPRAQPRAGHLGAAAGAERGALRRGSEPVHADSVERPARLRRAARQAARDGRIRGAPRRQCADAARGRPPGHPGRAAWRGTTCRRRSAPRSSDYNLLRIGVYPLPVGKIRAAARRVDRGVDGRGGLPVHRALRQRAGPDARAADQGQAHRAPAAQRRALAGRAAAQPSASRCRRRCRFPASTRCWSAARRACARPARTTTRTSRSTRPSPAWGTTSG